MKRMKKVLAMLLAFAMVMGMSMTSFAAITGAQLEVRNLSTEAAQNVNIYEIYRLDENDNLWVLADWAKTALNIETAEEEKAIDFTSESTLTTLKNAVENVPSDIQYSKTSTETDGVYESSVKFTGLQAGAYLVLVNDTKNETTYNPMIAITYKYNDKELLVADTEAYTIAKASSYTLDKVLADSEQDVVEVGDLVTYTIETTVPYVTNDEATFSLTDTLKGAVYYFEGEDAKLEVKVGGTTVNTEEFVDAYNGKDKFILDLNDYVSKLNTYAGQEVVVIYTVLVEAVNEVTNTIESEWAEESSTKSWTGNVEITKYNENKTKTLEGASFALYRLKEDGTKEYAVLDSRNYVTGEWVTNIIDEETEKVIDEVQVTTDANGKANVYGLDEGTYYFQEVIAPDGYSINTEDSEVKLEATKDNQGVITEVKGTTFMTDTTLSALPATGGIGTAVFTIGGCAIMIAAAYFFFVSRKKES